MVDEAANKLSLNIIFVGGVASEGSRTREGIVRLMISFRRFKVFLVLTSFRALERYWLKNPIQS